MMHRQLKRFNYTLLIVLLLSACGSGPEPEAVPTETISTETQSQDPIKSIQERFTQINGWLNGAELRMDSFPYECSSDPAGGKISLFRHEGQIVMLRHDYHQGDHFGATETYYLRHEKPVFVFVEEETWQFAGPVSDTPHTQDNIKELRYYYEDFQAGETQNAIRCLEKEYVIRSWVDIPLNKDQIPNTQVDCGPGSMDLLKKFSDLVRVELNGFGC